MKDVYLLYLKHGVGFPDYTFLGAWNDFEGCRVRTYNGTHAPEITMKDFILKIALHTDYHYYKAIDIGPYVVVRLTVL